MPGVTTSRRWPNSAFSFAASRPEEMTPSQPVSTAPLARASTSCSTFLVAPISSRSRWSKLVSTVTARIFIAPFSLAAASITERWPWTVRKVAPRWLRLAVARRTVSGMS